MDTDVFGPAAAAHGEAALVARAQAGDERAFGELADLHSTPLRRLLYRITRDCEAAKDAVQEALTRAWLNIARFEGRSRFSTWLTRIGINEAYRATARSRDVLLEDEDSIPETAASDGSAPDGVVESRELLARIAVALDELPPDYRTAVVLRDVEGRSTKEAAGEVGIGERAFKSRLHRGRLALRRELGDQLD